MGASEIAVAAGRGRAPAPADQRRLDSNFFLFLVALIWLGILMGFMPEIAQRVHSQRPFPTVVYYHGAVFVAWLGVLSAQLLLIRSRRIDLHRELGMAGTALYGAMVVLGLTTSVVVDHHALGTHASDPAFLSVQLSDMLCFTVLGGAALALRSRPDAHKRLILLATIFLANAGYSRWWAGGLEKVLGDGYIGFWAQMFLSDLLLVVTIGVYDLVTRRRLYAAYVVAAVAGLAVEFAAVWLYMSPWWKSVATGFIGG